MSKCKAVIAQDKVTEITIKTKDDGKKTETMKWDDVSVGRTQTGRSNELPGLFLFID